MQSRADQPAHSLKVIEKAPQKVPPIYKFKPPDGSSPLRRFIALPEDTLLVLGARRTPPVIPPPATSNTDDTVSVCTAVGFRALKAEDYADASENLKPDIIVALGDIPYGRALGSKRVEKATDRSIAWLQDHVSLRNTTDRSPASSHLFASLLPVSCVNQQFYIEALSQDLAKEIHGLAIYDLAPLEDLPKGLHDLPRLAFLEPSTPGKVLQHISLGIDVLTLPFVAASTDAGIALDFAFPVPEMSNGDLKVTQPRLLGTDMWLSDHATDLDPMVQHCQCYACVNHHKAYVQHLLAAKEMLGWVLLQIHNHHVIDRFFSGIRQSIADGTFESDVRKFEQTYESQLPEKTGQGPRVRGYHFKSEGPSEPKKNKPPFTTLDDKSEKLAESVAPTVGTDAGKLEEQGFAERP